MVENLLIPLFGFASGDLDSVILKGCLLAGRLAPAVLLTPFLGGRPVPSMVKVSVVLALIVAAFPAAPDVPAGAVGFAAVFASELAKGCVFGFVASLGAATFSMAGRIVDTMCGTGFASVLVPQLEERESPLSGLYFFLYGAVFFCTGAHLVFIGSLVGSYEIMPAGQGFAQPGAVVPVLVGLVTSSIKLCAAVAGPSIAAGVLSEAAVGLAARSFPQMNAFLIGMPLRLLGGMFMCLLGLAACLRLMAAEAGGLPANILIAFGLR